MTDLTHRALAVLVVVAISPTAGAITLDNASVTGVTIVTVTKDDNRLELESKIVEWLGQGKRLAVTGPRNLLRMLKPDGIYSWPTTNTVVLDPSEGLGVFGFDANDASSRSTVLRSWPWAERAAFDETPRPARSADGPSRPLDVTFDLSVAAASSE